jgi:hypothetical protein
MTRLLILCSLLCLAALPALAYSAADEVVDRIAAHFEAASSRLRPEDAEPLDQFVSRVRNTPGARLAILVPITTEPARSRFVAARVTELERHVQSLAETAEYRHIVTNSNADVLWLALVLPAPASKEEARAAPLSSQNPVDLTPIAPAALTAPTEPVVSPAPASPADIRLTDWVVRGVKRPPQGPVSAFVARTTAGAVPREVFERQADQDLGLIKEISLSPDAGWVVRTEIGWIGQRNPAGDR